MSSPENNFPMHVGIVVVSAAQLASVYALLGAGASTWVVDHKPAAPAQSIDQTPVQGTALSAEQLAGTTPAALADENAGKRDAAGTLFDPARHTGSIVKSGLWRMKAGMSRGPGEGEDSLTYVNPNGSAPAATASTAPAAAFDEDDEFAAFTAAAAAPAATVKARTWADADLSKLTNQAAQKLGSADKVRETIAKFVPADATPHSRNIPTDKREAFAQAIEAVAGIEYAG